MRSASKCTVSHSEKTNENRHEGSKKKWNRYIANTNNPFSIFVFEQTMQYPMLLSIFISYFHIPSYIFPSIFPTRSFSLNIQDKYHNRFVYWHTHSAHFKVNKTDGLAIAFDREKNYSSHVRCVDRRFARRNTEAVYCC